MHNFVSIHNYLKVVRPLHKDLHEFCLRANEITFSEHWWTGQMKSPHTCDLQYFSQDSLAQKFLVLWFHLPCRIYGQYQGKWNHLTGHLKSMIFMIFCTKYACEKIQLTGFYVEDIFRNWLGIYRKYRHVLERFSEIFLALGLRPRARKISEIRSRTRGISY